MYTPMWEALPALRVRCDIVVASKGIDEAIETFAAVILKESRAMRAMPLNTWIEVRVDTRGAVAATSAVMTAAQVEENTSKLFAMVRKAVLSAHVRWTSLLDTPLHSCLPCEWRQQAEPCASAGFLKLCSMQDAAN